jgi:hypothetical protein
MSTTSARARCAEWVAGWRYERPAKKGCEKGTLTTVGHVATMGIARRVESARSGGMAWGLRPR